MLNITIIREMKSKQHWDIPITSEWLALKSLHTTNAGEDVEKREPLYTVAGNVNWCNHHGKQHGSSSKNKIELLYDPAIPLLGIYLEKKITLIQKTHAPQCSQQQYLQ